MKDEAGTNLVVRVTPEEMDAIRKAAAECEMNVSQYIRAIIFKRKIKRAKPIVLNSESAQCVKCKSEFKPVRHWQKYCSEKCRMSYYWDRKEAQQEPTS